MSLTQIVVMWGAVLGLVGGVVSRRINFCVMGSLADAILMGSSQRLRAWGVAVAVAVIGTQTLVALQLLNVAHTQYTALDQYWLAMSLGGFLFGVGMVLASGCGLRSLVRLGGGNLKALVVLLVVSVTALATLKGVLGLLRVSVFQSPAVTIHFSYVPTLAAFLHNTVGGALPSMQWMISSMISFILLAWALSNREFRGNYEGWLGGAGMGFLIVVAWYITGHVGYYEDSDVMEMVYGGTSSRLAEAMSFVGPLGYWLEWLVYGSDKTRVLTFGMTVSLGVFLGALAQALWGRQFRWEYFTSRNDLVRHLAGSVLMGFGGVLALGCTIGQGVGGLSLLSLGSIMTILSIVAGAVVTIKYEMRQMA